MSQQIVLSTPTETETVCTACKHFMEFEGALFCRFFDACLSPETFCIPCEFQEKIENPVGAYQKNGESQFTKSGKCVILK
jgi:hypothetical protein